MVTALAFGWSGATKLIKVIDFLNLYIVKLQVMTRRQANVIYLALNPPHDE